MVKRISKILGILLLVACMSTSLSQAAAVTELLQVTIPYDTGLYITGDTLQITVTYDNTGTTMHRYDDGLNGIAEFGSGDDTVFLVYELADYASSSYSMFSDAAISISGLKSLPSGSTPADVQSTNMSWCYETETSGNTYWYLMLSRDDLVFIIRNYFYADGTEYQLLAITQYATNASGENTSFQATAEKTNNPFITRNAVTGVPEPVTILLLGLGLAGLAGTMRKIKK